MIAKNKLTFLTPLMTYPLNVLKVFDSICREEVFFLFETSYVTHEEKVSYLFVNPAGHLSFYDTDDARDFFYKIEKFLENGYYACGYFTYEFSYSLIKRDSLRQHRHNEPLAEFFFFNDVRIYDHEFCNSYLTNGSPIDSCFVFEFDEYKNRLTFNIEEDEYIQSIEKIKRYIETGDTYQVNYTFKLHFNCDDPFRLYLGLRRNQAVSYGAFIKIQNRYILSLSPELFFRKCGRFIFTKPMKGTLRRGLNLEEDIFLANNLKKDPKNRAENVMIVDLLRNDLGKISETGSVKVESLFDISRYNTLFQMTSQISSYLREEVDFYQIFSALFPSGSVTGAPKIRTMEIIRELEKEPRGVYTGALGFFTPDKNAIFNIPIRTIDVRGTQAEMGIGSGITYDSNPLDEFKECKLKARFLFNIKSLHDEFYIVERIKWRKLPEGHFLINPLKAYFLLDLHLKRLYESALYFDFKCDLMQLKDILYKKSIELAKSFHEVVVRLLLNKYGQVKLEIIQLEDTPRSGLKVLLSKTKIDPSNVFLYHKTTQRGLYDQELRKAKEKGYFDVVFVNTRGEVTEGAITNVFIRRRGELVTPPLTCGLLNGTLRQYLIANGIVREDVISLDEIKACSHIYVGNSVRGILKVSFCVEE